MEITSHLRKADRLAASMRRTDREHSIATLWAAMHASTQALNALLHLRGVTPEEVAYPTMTRGLYLVPSTTGRFEPVQRRSGDVIHATKGGSTLEWLHPEWNGLPADVQEAATLVADIENRAKSRARDPGDSDEHEVRAVLRNCEAVLSMAVTAVAADSTGG